jgi:hypothetical protein
MREALGQSFVCLASIVSAAVHGEKLGCGQPQFPRDGFGSVAGLHHAYTLKTTDCKERLLDRAVGAAIWAACVASDSLLPEARWQSNGSETKGRKMKPKLVH